MSNDKKDAMPAWPNPADFTAFGTVGALVKRASYERALCVAWEARCRKLAAALIAISRDSYADEDGIFRPCTKTAKVEFAIDALNAIGPLPELPDLPSSERG